MKRRGRHRASIPRYHRNGPAGYRAAGWDRLTSYPLPGCGRGPSGVYCAWKCQPWTALVRVGWSPGWLPAISIFRRVQRACNSGEALKICVSPSP